MKKAMSKILIIFIILIMLFEFTCSGPISYAIEAPDSETVSELTNLIGGIAAFVLWIPRILLVTISDTMVWIMTDGVAENCGISDAKVFEGKEEQNATPFDIFFDKYNLFSVDFFDIKNDGSLIDDIRISVAQWFYAMRLISAIVLMCVLIYVGIRMALSTIADEKAKYKKMLVDWSCSLALIFILQYIAVFTIEANKVIVNFLRDVSYSDINEALRGIGDLAVEGCSIASIVATFVYCMIAFQTISFMITYIQRMLKVGFLLIISPLISITYSIDKMGDGKAQALDTWLKEFVYTILIQPFHCIMYVAFVNTAINLLNMPVAGPLESLVDLFSSGDASFNQLANGFIVILCLKFINDGEKAIRKIFNFQDDASLTSMAAGAALGMAALSNAKKIGSATAKGFNKAKGLSGKFGKALANDLKPGSAFLTKLKDTPLKGVAEKIEKAGTGKDGKASSLLDKMPVFGKDGKGSISKAVGKFQNSKFWTNHGTKLTALANAGKTGLGVAGKAFRKSMPIALGMMGAAMSYATGTSGAMEAIGVGSALNSGANEFFSASTSTLAKQKAENNEKWGDAQYKRALNDKDNQIRAKTADNKAGSNLSASDIADKAARVQKYEAALAEPKLNIGDKMKNGKKATQKDIAEQKRRKKAAKTGKQQLMQEFKGSTGSKKEAEELYNLYKERGELASSEGKKAFLKEKMTKENLSSISYTKHGKADIEAKKNEIMQKILALKAAQNAKNGQVANDQENHFSDSDMESAESAMKFITDSIDRNVVSSGGSLDMSKLLKDSMGLEDDGSDAYQAIMGSVLDYQDMSIAADAENIENNASSAGIDDDSFQRSAYRRTRNFSKSNQTTSE